MTILKTAARETIIWPANVTLNDSQPTDSLARRSFVFMLNW